MSNTYYERKSDIISYIKEVSKDHPDIFQELKELIESIDVAKTDMEKLRELVEDELSALEDWKLDLISGDYGTGYMFDKEPFLEILTPEFIKENNSHYFFATILEMYEDIRDEFYSIPGDVAEDEQLKELNELIKYISETTTDAFIKFQLNELVSKM